MTQETLSPKDIRTLGLAALGGALEFYDFVIFVFFAKTIGVLFFPEDMPGWLSQLQTYGIFAAGYLARPIGGIIMAHFGDKVGRKKMFTLSVFLMAIPTFAIGFLPTYTQIGIAAPLTLLALRVLQGLAIGGEVPAAWVFVAEHVPKSYRGFACASLTSGLTAGILLGSLMASYIYSTLPAEDVLNYGWRVPFVIGGVFGFCAVWLRKWLSETPVFEALKARKEIDSGIPLKSVLRDHRKSVVISMLVTWTLTAAIVVVILMMPTLVQISYGVEASRAFHGSNWASFALVFGCLAGGFLADKIGRARALLMGSLFLVLNLFALYRDLQSGAEHFISLYALTGFSVGVVGIVPSIMIAAFPAAVRFSGLSFSYNMSYAIFGALTPPVISFMATHYGKVAPGYYVALTCLVSALVALYLVRQKQEF